MLEIINYNTAPILQLRNATYPFAVTNISNVATLRTTEPSFDGQVITLLGHTVDSIGGGQFFHDASDTTTADDNGTVIVTAGGKRWKRMINGIVNIDDFGCIPDTGIDNTVNMQNALDTIGVVTASLGRYKIGDVLVPTGASILCNSGRAYNQTIHGKTIFEALSTAFTVFDMSNCKGFKFSTFIVDCNVTGAYRNTHGCYAKTANCNQGVVQDVSVHYADISFGSDAAYTFNSTIFRGAIANQGRTGYARLVDCNLINCVAAGNIERPISLLTGHNSNRFVNFTSEWNAKEILLFETASISFIGGFFDRAFKSAFHISSTKNTVISAPTVKRSGRNSAVSITGGGSSISRERSHFLIEGVNEGLTISAPTTSTGVDDAGGSETTTLSPEHIFEWIAASNSIDTTITGGTLTGFRTSFSTGTKPTDKLIIQDNSGAETLVIGQEINMSDGQVYQSKKSASSIASAGTAVLNMTNQPVSTFSKEQRLLNVSVRRADSINSFAAVFNLALTRESGSASHDISAAFGVVGASGSITTDGGGGTVCDLTFGNFSTDGSTFDITVTNNYASSAINVEVILK